MIWLIVGSILVLGMLLSAFFSGSETGFYRVTRVRLVLDGLGGDSVARALLWLTNHPALFVATTLIGNNVANYLTSLAVVLGTHNLVGHTQWAEASELLASIVLAPLMFVYGELLPKNLYYSAPNLLLRRGGPFFLLFTVLFAPISALLWASSIGLQRLLGRSPVQVRLALARAELSRLFEEGHQAGILYPAQRHLAQALFDVANRPVMRFATPPGRAVAVPRDSRRSDVLRLARRQGQSAIPVEEIRGGKRQWIGYVRMIDLSLTEGESLSQLRPFLEIHDNETHVAALIRMQTEQAELGKVVNSQGETIGLVSASDLTESLFRHG